MAFPSERGRIRAANGISFEVRAGETVEIVGESGSGKSVTLRALIRLVQPPAESGAEASGSTAEISAVQSQCASRDPWQRDRDDLPRSYGESEPAVEGGRPALRGPSSEPRPKTTRRAERAAALFERVGLRSARLDAYPHELSRGMAQRVMIAIAIATQPQLLLAYEPTTALDVSVQDQVLTLLTGSGTRTIWPW